MKTAQLNFRSLLVLPALALLALACEMDPMHELPSPGEEEVTLRDQVKTVPFRGTWTGVALPDSEPLGCFVEGMMDDPALVLPAQYTLEGKGTHLGRVREAGSSLTGSNCTFDPKAMTIAYDLELVVTAANGDQLVFHTRCLTSLEEGTTEGNWTVVGERSTGRFAGASGSGINFGRVDTSDPAQVSYQSNFVGRITPPGRIK